MRRPKTTKVKINLPRQIPDKIWRLNYGWGMSLIRFDGEKVIRTGMCSREEALEQVRYALHGPHSPYISAWIYEMTQPSKVLSLRRPQKE